jgi:alpha-D-ribose 1-methylphosphonate 5-triphosphate synthase subunit PhnG
MKSLVGYEWPEGRSKQVAYISQDHHVHELVVSVNGTWQHANLMTQAGAPVASSRFLVGFAWPEGNSKQVAYLGQEGHIQELRVSMGGNWQHVDVSMLTGAPPAMQVTAGYSWAEGRSKQIVFVGDDHHIHELCVEVGKSWRHIDLTTMTNAPLPGSQFMVGYEWAAGRSKQVAYVGQDGHIHELSLEAGGIWQHEDLSLITDAPRAVDLTVGYEWPEGQCKQVAFVSEDHHLHELYRVVGNAWRHADLSSMTNAPLATNILTGYAWEQGHSKQIAYIGLDGRIHEVYVEAGKEWHHVDLTALANVPLSSITALDGYSWAVGDSKQVVYTGEDGDIHELWMPRTGNWTSTNLSQTIMALPAKF